MAVVRKIIDSDKLAKIIDLPVEMKNIKVELTIRPIKEHQETDIFDPNSYRGILQIDDIEEKIKQIRIEWDRF